MNHLLYNISIVMLLIGILMLTYYLTKAYNNQTSNTNQQSGSVITDTNGQSAYFPPYYYSGSGSQEINFYYKVHSC